MNCWALCHEGDEGSDLSLQLFYQWVREVRAVRAQVESEV